MYSIEKLMWRINLNWDGKTPEAVKIPARTLVMQARIRSWTRGWPWEQADVKNTENKEPTELKSWADTEVWKGKESEMIQGVYSKGSVKDNIINRNWKSWLSPQETERALLKVMDNIHTIEDVRLDGEKSRLAMYMCELITVKVIRVNEISQRRAPIKPFDLPLAGIMFIKL